MENKPHNDSVEEVFNSMKGSQRAKPNRDLLARIERNLYTAKDRIIPLNQLRYLAAAAMVLLCLNTIAIYQINQSVESNITQSNVTSNSILISNYKIYK